MRVKNSHELKKSDESQTSQKKPHQVITSYTWVKKVNMPSHN